VKHVRLLLKQTMPVKELRRLRRLQTMAKELQVSNRTMYTLLKEGLPFIKRGRLIWLDPERVYRWLSKFERQAKR
jgi:hypothetical protein